MFFSINEDLLVPFINYFKSIRNYIGRLHHKYCKNQK